MDDQQKDQEVFRQNLNEKGNFQTLFQIYLLFTHKGSRPDGKDIQKTLLSKFEKVDIVANVKDSLSTLLSGNTSWNTRIINDCPHKY